MTQKTQLQQLAEHVQPIVDEHPASGSANKQLDLMAYQLMQEIIDGQQVLVDASEYEQFKQWQDGPAEE